VSNRRTLMAAAAIVLALVAGIGVYLYAAGADQRAQDNASFVNALVANSDIAKGTTGAEVIQAGLVSKEKVAKGSLPASMVTNLDDLNDRIAAGPINAKQFITEGSWVSAENGVGGAFSQSIAAQNLVAVTVTVDADHGVANQITPGDHVNIATTVTGADGNAETTYLLDSVKVLAVGASTSQQQAATAAQPAADGSTPPQTSGVLTFEVSQADALRVISANSGSSKLYLVLLPPATSSSSSSGGTKATASSK
jgi:pilus assembly protein CpaB